MVYKKEKIKLFVIKEDNIVELIREDGSIVDLPPYEISQSDYGIRVTFPNNWQMSIQWGTGAFCERNMEDRPGIAYDEQGNITEIIKEPVRPWQSKNAEIAAWNKELKDDSWYKFPNGDIIQGYLTVEEVVEYLILIGEQGNPMPITNEKEVE